MSEGVEAAEFDRLVARARSVPRLTDNRPSWKEDIFKSLSSSSCPAEEMAALDKQMAALSLKRRNGFSTKLQELLFYRRIYEERQNAADTDEPNDGSLQAELTALLQQSSQLQTKIESGLQVMLLDNNPTSRQGKKKHV